MNDDFNIETVDKDDFLEIVFFGSWNGNNGTEVMNNMHSTILASGHKKIFIDYTSSDFMDNSTGLAYKEACEASSYPNVYRYKFASLFSPEEIESRRFWENVAVNRGMKIKLFVCPAKAIEWLLA